MIKAALVLGVVAILFTPASRDAHAQAIIEPDRTVERIADLIEENYFDAAKAAAIALELRGAVERGEFRSLTDPRDLAARLSVLLQPEDGHLSVEWSASDGPVAASPSASQMDEAARAARWNFGFRRVEVLSGNIGLIELSEFADFDAESMWDSPARAAADAALALVERSDALIIDLRDNGGGGGMVSYLLGYFLPPGLAFSDMRGRTHKRESRVLERIGGRHRPGVPLYVVVSGRTGSAAEFFAYSLQALQRATVVGERTAGAANPGMTFDAGRGFEVFIPLDAPINRRTGTNWEGVGVRPDVAVEAPRAVTRAHIAALERVLQGNLTEAEARDVRWSLAAMTTLAAADASDLASLTGTFGNRVVNLESGTLVLRRGRWPGRTLRPLGGDLFFVEGAPWRRVRFERDSAGRVVALIEATSAGGETRWRRLLSEREP